MFNDVKRTWSEGDVVADVQHTNIGTFLPRRGLTSGVTDFWNGTSSLARCDGEAVSRALDRRCW